MGTSTLSSVGVAKIAARATLLQVVPPLAFFAGVPVSGKQFAPVVGQIPTFHMTFFRSATIACAATLLAVSPASATLNLLLNGGFESNTSGLSNGNNINQTGQPAGWTVVSGESNVQQGAAQGTGFSSANLAPYNGAYSGGATTGTTATHNQNTDTGGNHFFDGTVDVNGYTTITQTFTLATGTNLSGSYALGIRDSGGNQAGTAANFVAGNTSRIDIYAGTGTTGTSILTSYGDTLSTGATGSANPGWEVNSFAVNNVSAGTYTFRIELAGSQNIDAVNLVPEPSSCALLGLGAGLLGLISRRRALRV